MKLREWMAANGLAVHQVARALEVADVTVYGWLNRGTSPHPNTRRDIHVLTDGQVDQVEDWPRQPRRLRMGAAGRLGVLNLEAMKEDRMARAEVEARGPAETAAYKAQQKWEAHIKAQEQQRAASAMPDLPRAPQSASAGQQEDSPAPGSRYAEFLARRGK